MESAVCVIVLVHARSDQHHQQHCDNDDKWEGIKPTGVYVCASLTMAETEQELLSMLFKQSKAINRTQDKSMEWNGMDRNELVDKRNLFWPQGNWRDFVRNL